MDEANELFLEGHILAAVAVARAEIESWIVFLSAVDPDRRLPIGWRLKKCLYAGEITKSQYKALCSFFRAAGRLIHAPKKPFDQAAELLAAAAAILQAEEGVPCKP
jgi:hypothetical protein